MIKSIGKIAVLPLGLIVVLGSATGVSAMRTMTQPRSVITTQNPSTFGSTGEKIASQTIMLTSMIKTSPETQSNTHRGNQSKLKESPNKGNFGFKGALTSSKKNSDTFGTTSDKISSQPKTTLTTMLLPSSKQPTTQLGSKSLSTSSKNNLDTLGSTSDKISSQPKIMLTSMIETSPETQSKTKQYNQSKLPVKSKPTKFGKSNISQSNVISTSTDSKLLFKKQQIPQPELELQSNQIQNNSLIQNPYVYDNAKNLNFGLSPGNLVDEKTSQNNANKIRTCILTINKILADDSDM